MYQQEQQPKSYSTSLSRGSEPPAQCMTIKQQISATIANNFPSQKQCLSMSFHAKLAHEAFPRSGLKIIHPSVLYNYDHLPVCMHHNIPVACHEHVPCLLVYTHFVQFLSPVRLRSRSNKLLFLIFCFRSKSNTTYMCALHRPRCTATYDLSKDSIVQMLSRTKWENVVKYLRMLGTRRGRRARIRKDLVTSSTYVTT
jgi:hypothetical protein